MRYVMILASVLAMLSSQDVFASPKTDSIVTFLGGSHAKFVWPRWAWCNDNYTPKTKSAAVAEGLSLMLMDTRAGTERALITGLTSAGEPRISRSGKWATVIEGKKSYIVDLTVSTPVKKVLLDVSTTPAYYLANAWWIDPANGDEYVFATDFITDKGSTAIWKFKVNADGTANLPATKLTINSTNYIVGGISISADGKKLGAAFPWPDTKILDIPTGNLLDRHNGMFGCQPNLAPDNSYRFFHCQDDHLGIIMFGSNLQDNTNWYVNLATNLVGVSGGMDFMAPRWSNHVQYYTAQCPMGDNYENNCPNPFGSGDDDCPMESGTWWGLSASQVQQISMSKVSKFFLGKFSADFKSQEKSIMVGADRRYMQYTGDAWICNGTTYGNQCTTVSTSPAIRGSHLPGLSVEHSGAFVNVRAAAGATVRITDARGRIVRMWSGPGTCALDAQSLAAGAYMVSITAGARSEIVPLPLVRSLR